MLQFQCLLGGALETLDSSPFGGVCLELHGAHFYYSWGVLDWWKIYIMPSVVRSEIKEGEGLEKGVIALMEVFPVPMRHPMR